MKFKVIIQARMGSNRLPGKSFFKINNRTLIDYLVESILPHVKKADIILATSLQKENDILRDYADKKEITCYSGDEKNVASRYRDILSRCEDITHFFRICGDSPYYDGGLIRRALDVKNLNIYDYVTSMPNKGYPMGCNVELFKKSTFLKNYDNFETKEHFEHVTKYFYDNKSSFQQKELNCNIDSYKYEDYKFSVDTLKDFELAKMMLNRMNYEPWKYNFLDKIEIQKNIKYAHNI